MRKYLLVIDMQNDFIDGVLGTKEACAIVPNVVKHLHAAEGEGREIIFTQDTHHTDYLQKAEGKLLPVPHCIACTKGWQLHPSMTPFAKHISRKPTFGSIELVEEIKQVAQKDGINLDIALCGVCTDICVVSNALLLRAHFPEATLRVYADACAGVTPASHDAALMVMRACHVQVMEGE